jgi:hypothetical protein
MMRTSVFVNVLLQRRLHVHLNLVLGYCCAAAEPPASASDVHADLLLDVMQHNLTLQPWQRDSLRALKGLVPVWESCLHYGAAVRKGAHVSDNIRAVVSLLCCCRAPCEPF